MQVGTDWAGSYSRFSYNELSQYFYMLKEQGKPVLDDEFNISQEIQLTLLRRLVEDTYGNGSPNNGFLVVGTGANNDFTIKGGGGTADTAGHLYVNGYMVVLPSDTTYQGQPIAQAALTVPSGNRTDQVYVDMYLDEVGPTQDALIVDPTLNIETSRRLKLYWQVKVAEGGTTPAQYTDANNRVHYTYQIATLNRTAQASITAGMVVDNRNTYANRWALLAGNAAQVFNVANAVAGSEAVNLSQANALYAQLGVANVFTAAQTAPDWQSTQNSDPRIKSHIQPLSLKAEDFAGIGTYNWLWRSTNLPGIGGMAPEVGIRFPGCVYFDKDGNATGLEYGKTAFLMGRTSLDEIVALKARVTDLEDRLASLSRPAVAPSGVEL